VKPGGKCGAHKSPTPDRKLQKFGGEGGGGRGIRGKGKAARPSERIPQNRGGKPPIKAEGLGVGPSPPTNQSEINGSVWRGGGGKKKQGGPASLSRLLEVKKLKQGPQPDNATGEGGDRKSKGGV